MRNRAWIILLIVLILTAGAAAFLATQRSRQRLGQPGVKVVAQPVYGLNSRGPGTNREPFIARTNSVYLPEAVLDYRSEPAPIPQLVLETLPADTLFGHRVYQRDDGLVVDCQVVLMGADRSSIHQPQHCLAGNGLEIMSKERGSIPMAKPYPYDLQVMKLKLRGEKALPDGTRQPVGGVFVYWYVADEQLTADHGRRMWLTARDVLTTGVLQRWAYVIFYAACPLGQEEETYERLKEFVVESVPEFQLAHGPPVTRVTRK